MRSAAWIFAIAIGFFSSIPGVYAQPLDDIARIMMIPFDAGAQGIQCTIDAAAALPETGIIPCLSGARMGAAVSGGPGGAVVGCFLAQHEYNTVILGRPCRPPTNPFARATMDDFARLEKRVKPEVQNQIPVPTAKLPRSLDPSSQGKAGISGG